MLVKIFEGVILPSLSVSDVIVLDAAVLLEAGWDSMVHEIWTTLVPRDEVNLITMHQKNSAFPCSTPPLLQAIKRIMERNKLSEEAAAQRVDAQTPNEAKVERAHVAICTLWEYEYTQQQVLANPHIIQMSF